MVWCTWINFYCLRRVSYFFPVEPITTYTFFSFLWLGFILFVDSLVKLRTKHSRLTDNPKSFFLLFPISAFLWWFYEVLNFFIDNWNYAGIGKPEWLMFSIAFSTVLPAILETSDLLSSFDFFKKIKTKIKLTDRKLLIIVMLGITCLILPFVIPKYTFALVWVSMFLLLDPINYLTRQPSILGSMKKGSGTLLWTLMIGTLICGFFWEFWNFWAPAKWFYTVPFVGFFKIFEMPILGYLGYLPFGLSNYALYNFVIGIIKKKK